MNNRVRMSVIELGFGDGYNISVIIMNNSL